MRKWLILLLSATASTPTWAVPTAVFEEFPDGTQILLEVKDEPGRSPKSPVEVMRFPKTIVEHQEPSKSSIVKYRSRDPEAFASLRDPIGAKSRQDEYFPIILNGPAENRIDVVFMGDGYTNRAAFEEDVRWMVKDLFEGPTFGSWLPLFNIHGVFRKSKQEGISIDGAGDTAYGLYRNGNTLRGIFPGNPSAARQSCRAAPGCDYPVIIANDNRYGGLGGEFAITTRSRSTGHIVLRHELGHNFGRVGEEYDGGGYFGANHSSSLSSLSWKHWLSGPLRAEPSAMLLIDWPWHEMSQGPWSADLRVSADATALGIVWSAAGVESSDKFQLQLDSTTVATVESDTTDRQFSDHFTRGVPTPGRHTLTFLQDNEGQSPNLLGNVAVHEYYEGFQFDQDHVSAYPVFGSRLQNSGFRPTWESCLMREMNHPGFCAVCQENNWLQFFQTIEMIDALEVEDFGDEIEVRLAVLPLGLGDHANVGKVSIKWFREGELVQGLTDQKVLRRSKPNNSERWSVEVQWQTEEVRLDKDSLLTSRKTFEI